MTATIWHNPRCSKSRAVLALIEARGVEVEVVRYLDTPPSRDRLTALLAAAGLAPREVLRAGEPGADRVADASDAEVLAAIAADPRLLERPLVETARGVRLCRPPERVLELL